jgi:tetratricopeptide (TPR) repeat protein
MELAIQKATVLDPENARYHLLFSRVLVRNSKLDRAERHADLAIEHSPNPNPGLYRHRAKIRWKRQDYEGAIEDWQGALALRPGTAAIHASLVKAFERLGQWAEAESHAAEAVRIAPDDEAIRKTYEALVRPRK